MLKPPASLRKKMINGRYEKLVKIFLVTLAVLSLFVLSEIVYIFNNKPIYFSYYFLNKSRKSASNHQLQDSMKYLMMAAEINIYFQVRNYPELIPKTFNPEIIIPKNNTLYNQAYLTYMKNIDIKKIINSEKYDLARLFYTLALIAYRNNQQDLVVPFLQTAVYLNPELSHLHVELSNFYLFLGYIEKAENSINYCLKFKYPIKHCEDYIKNNLSANISEEPGFIEKELEKYYSSLK